MAIRAPDGANKWWGRWYTKLGTRQGDGRTAR